ncbi:helix-turn-helix domain-containing protein [Halobacillus litoralis]|uniref:Helix-turn-helix domain-containing protein n=1 Tax=Halobacillus litoralis TaxID=45668 RepID=A0A845EJL4_9BACI|nr:AraC family transcriptional regulator [Halobacillus litoralis]MYL51378.1 helix-turn-helix domain-containing protein [Halobacillus litoralis]
MIWSHDQGLILKRTDYLGERDWRTDDCYKLIFSPFGKGLYQTPQGDVSIEQEGFLLFNPCHKHKQLSAAKEKFLVEIRPELLQEAVTERSATRSQVEFATLSYKHPHLNQWAHFVRDFFFYQKGEGADLFLDHSLTQLAVLLMEYGPGSHQVEWPVVHGREPVHRAMNAMRESYSEAWSLDAMAAVAHMNKYQFSHAFKKETGFSPYSWLQVYRLFRSQSSLMNKEDSVLSIALEHGFSSMTTYNHLFKRIYQKTPTQFREFYKMNRR